MCRIGELGGPGRVYQLALSEVPFANVLLGQLIDNQTDQVSVPHSGSTSTALGHLLILQHPSPADARGHDWRVIGLPDGSLEWVAQDARSAQRSILHIPLPNGEGVPQGQCRRRYSAEYAIAVYGTWKASQISALGVAIIGTCDDDGKRRTCPAVRFYQCLADTLRSGQSIPLMPSSCWLNARLGYRGANGNGGNGNGTVTDA